MEWKQIYDPIGNIWLSAGVASLPIILFFVSLVVLKLKGWKAALFTVLLSSFIAVFVYKMPVVMVFLSFSQGFMNGLWPIAWIILAAIFLYKLSVKSGYFEYLKSSVIAITPDHRIQVILIAYCFGAFLEGAIGFGGPVAITAALLMGLGLRPLYAAGLCMIANTAPVAFGAIGIPIIAMSHAVGVDPVSVGAMVGRILPPITLFVPFFIVFLMDGMKGVKETFPVIAIASVSFAITQYITSNSIGPELPDITSAIVSLVCTTLFLRVWHVKNVFRVKSADEYTETSLSTKQILLAWIPFIFLIITVVLWTLPIVKNSLAFSTFNISMPYINGTMIQTAPIVLEDTSIKSVFKFDLLGSVGTAIFFAAILTIFALKIKPKMAVKAASETVREMFIPVINIGLVVAYAYIAKNSAQAATMGLALSHTGDAFAFFSPIIGWLGVFLTGSDTSSNLLFGPLQQVTAHQLNIPDIMFLAANSVGGVVGKMISPQSIAVACAAVGLVGRESELFRFTVKYSILFIIAIGVICYIITHFLPFIIPA
ncbi:lactate permease LctP family transporter [Campylobacter sp. RM12327]|uniref:lactate permease LctP family transporter n=1 Tax=Campylobacter sputorum TaxID=206 RepID=UPI00053BE002|nr:MULTISPECIES: lactate permease LctP family transporter [Campylobacter]ASM40066.1 L-lactate permease [Campylobacter sputorum]MBE7358175.1 lactate permease LctP family transporter [Campylobacter sp. RM11302]MBF6669429.1 lactate permease LctP family transporter [Campylobacter sp. RM12327]MBF6674434.1 lactate permease LctP family transporter [Campylobacter sp. RM13538]MBF6676184.1 lactate permease LctP family transporter [Campylobacter sp. RM12321]